MIPKLDDYLSGVSVVVAQCLRSHHVGKGNAVSGKAIAFGMNKNYKSGAQRNITDADIRNVIQYLRVSGKCEGICSCSLGYYIGTNDELQECIDDLRDRMATQYQTYRALKNQLYSRVNGTQQNLWQ